MACNTDLDCPRGQICYTNITWYDTAVYGTEGCLCSTWYGWTGVGCSELTSVGMFWLGSSIVLTVVSLLAGIIAVYNAFQLIHSRRFSLLHDATTTANWQLILGFVSQAASQILYSVESFNPDLLNLATNAAGDRITDTTAARQFLIALMCCATVVAALTTALMWMEIAKRADTLALSTHGTVIPNTRRFVYSFEVVYVAFIVGFAGALLPNIALAIGMFGAFIVVGIYVVGFIQLRRQLKRIASMAASEEHGHMYKQVIVEITWMLSGILLAIAFVFIWGIVIMLNGLFSNWKENCPPNGPVPVLVVAWQILSGAVLATQIFLLYALRKATYRRLHTSQQNSGSAGSKNHGMAEHKFKNQAMKTSSAVVAMTEDRPDTRGSKEEASLAAYQLSTAEADGA